MTIPSTSPREHDLPLNYKRQRMNPAIEKFKLGYARFKEQYFVQCNKLYSKLRHAQTPKTLLIGCCDSRVDPAILTDCDPGDLFVVRNVANLVSPYDPDSKCHSTSSAMEYAVKVLKVDNIIILGHAKCGGIAALIDQSLDTFEFLAPWMGTAKKALTTIMNEHQDFTSDECKLACEHAAILESLKNIETYPWIKERLDNHGLQLHGWYFDFEHGDLFYHDKQAQEFVLFQ